jgi:(2Fe-2S) ferredoxin
MSYDRHFFVCTNERPAGGRPACAARGGAAILAALERGLAQQPALWGRVHITATSCLGPCFDGPCMVVYPEGVWYAGLTAADADDLVASHLVQGVPVDRLRYHAGGE